MKKLGFPAIMLFLAGVIGVGVWSYFYSPFPVRIRRLVQASVESRSSTRLQATLTLKKMGSQAIPSLLKLLAHNNPQVRRATAKALTFIQMQEFEVIRALQKALGDRDWQVRRNAATALGLRRWRAASAVPTLIRVLQREKEWLVRIELVQAIGRIGPFAKIGKNALLHSLKDSEWTVRRAALRSLHHIGLPAVEAVAAYQGMLRDPYWRVREKAAQNLGFHGRRALSAFPQLVQASQDANQRVRDEAVKALHRIGPRHLKRALRSKSPWRKILAAKALGLLKEKAASAVPQLVAATRDSRVTVRKAIMASLSQIGPKGVSAFLALLQHPRPSMRALAALRLRSLGRLSVITAPALYRMLQDGDREVRWAAAQAIARLPATLPNLRSLLAHRQPWVRRAAVKTLSRLGPKAVLIMLEALSNSDPIVRSRAAAALGRTPTHTALIIRDLAVALKDKVDGVKIAAAKALVRQGKKGRAVLLDHIHKSGESELLLLLESTRIFSHIDVKTTDELLLRLRRALGSSQTKHRITSAQILGKLGPKAGLATILLNKLLEDDDQDTRMEAIRALGNIGAKAKIAVPGLKKRVLKGKDDERLAAIQALVQLAGHSPRAIQAMRQILRRPQPELRRLAATAIAELGPKAIACLPDLLWALEDPRVRSQAARALGTLGPHAISTMINSLRSPKQWVRWTIIEVLATYGPKAKDAAPALRKALHDPITAVRIAAARALSQIDPQSENTPTTKDDATPGTKAPQAPNKATPAPPKTAPRKVAPRKAPAPRKAAPARRVPAKKAPAKRAPAKRAPAKKATKKRAAPAPRKAAPAKRAPAKRAPAKRAPAKTAPRKAAPSPAKKAPLKRP